MLRGVIVASRNNLQRFADLQKDARRTWWHYLSNGPAAIPDIQTNLRVRTWYSYTSGILEHSRHQDGEQTRVLVRWCPHTLRPVPLRLVLKIKVVNETALVVAVLSRTNQCCQRQVRTTTRPVPAVDGKRNFISGNSCGHKFGV